MSSLAGYDEWKCYDAAGERAEQRFESAISEPEIFHFQRRCELQEGRCAALTHALVTAHGERRARIERTLEWASRLALMRARQLEAAIEEWGEECDDRTGDGE